MKKKHDRTYWVKKIATWIIMTVMISIFVLDIVSDRREYDLRSSYTVSDTLCADADCSGRIHFLNVGNSDCMLLESGGHFALIDSGEGDSNPRKKDSYRGYKNDVISYLKEYAAGADGRVTLDFILGTHCHYDHIGSFEDIINDPDITIGRAYFKTFPSKTLSFEVSIWQNDRTYASIVAALKERDIPLITDLPETIALGSMLLTLYNRVTPSQFEGRGENFDSIGVKVVCGGSSAFLAADFPDKLEKMYASSIGHVDLLKISHHGYTGSSSREFLRTLSPEAAVLTNFLGRMWPHIKWRYDVEFGIPVFATPNCGGVVASFTSGGITLTEHVMDVG